MHEEKVKQLNCNKNMNTSNDGSKFPFPKSYNFRSSYRNIFLLQLRICVNRHVIYNAN